MCLPWTTWLMLVILALYVHFLLSFCILFYSFPSLLSLLCLCCFAVGVGPLSILSLCWSAVRLSLDIQPNRILLVTIHHMLYPITVEVLHQVFSPHGFVEKIVTFQKSAGQHPQIFSFLSFSIWYWLRCVKTVMSKCRVTLMSNTSIWFVCNSLLSWRIKESEFVFLLISLLSMSSILCLPYPMKAFLSASF